MTTAPDEPPTMLSYGDPWPYEPDLSLPRQAGPPDSRRGHAGDQPSTNTPNILLFTGSIEVATSFGYPGDEWVAPDLFLYCAEGQNGHQRLERSAVPARPRRQWQDPAHVPRPPRHRSPTTVPCRSTPTSPTPGPGPPTSTRSRAEPSCSGSAPPPSTQQTHQHRSAQRRPHRHG